MSSRGKTLDAALVEARTIGDAVVAKSCALSFIASDAFASASSTIKKLDISDNGLRSLSGVASTSLTWISAAKNALWAEALRALGDGCPRARTVNVSGNASLRTLKGVEKMKALAALIASECAIEDLSAVKGLKELNTLVCGECSVEDVGDALSESPALRKLNLSRNNIRKFSADALKSSGGLRELRVSHNALKAIPACVRETTNLRILDVGYNKIDNWGSLGDLRALRRLEQLFLRGCPIASEQGYEEKIIAMCPRLKILDGRKVGEPRRERAVEDERQAPRYVDKEAGSESGGEDYDDDAPREPVVEHEEDERREKKTKKEKKEKKTKRRVDDADEGERSFLEVFVGKNKGKLLGAQGAKEEAEKSSDESKRTGVVGVFENKDLKRKGPSGSAAFKALSTRAIVDVGSWDDDEPVKNKSAVEVTKKKDLKDMTPDERKAHLKLSRKRGY
jgi:hypothetical protein